MYRDLGLLTSDVLSWNPHIANITAQANSILGLIKGTCRDVNDVTTLKNLYCSLVRPRVEYASQVWNPYTKSNISRIESIQRRATKFILKSDDEYLFRLRKLRLSLEDRRRIMFTVGNVDRYVDRYIGGHSIDIAVASRSTVDRLCIDTRSTVDRQSIACRSTVLWQMLFSFIRWLIIMFA